MGNHILEGGCGIGRRKTRGETTTVRGKGIFDTMYKEFFQSFFHGSSSLRIHQPGRNRASQAGMDLGGAHEQISGQGGIRPMGFTQDD